MCLYLFKKSEDLDARRTPTTYKELKQNPNNSEDLLAEITGILVLTTIVIFPCISGIYMDKLEDERAPGHDTSPTGQQVPAHQALQHWALATALEKQNREGDRG